jgi:diguanylate cyclase (GGDEF)-like protein/PAS domain S-box-containing protein
MPDYNRRATAFWWTVATGGAVLLLACLVQLAQQPARVWLQVAAGVSLAMLAGLFPVRIPGTRNSFVASDVFIFLLLLVHGPAAAAVAVASEMFTAALRSSKRWTSRIVSPAIGVLSIVVSGSLLQAARSALGQPGAGGIATPAANGTVVLMALAMCTALLYFLLSATMVSGVLRLKRGERFFQLADVVSVFRWVGMACAGSAAFATLLYAVYLSAGIGVWMVMLPLLAMLLVTLHFYFRQQEAAQALRERSAEAEAQRAEADARHLRELQASERRFHGAFTHASIGMALLAFDGRILQGNAALGELLGQEAAALAGRRLQESVHAGDVAALEARLAKAGRGEFDLGAIELRFDHPAGDTPWAALHIAAFTEPDSGAPCLIVQAQDVTGRRVAEEQLHHLAFHDMLTGLPNRRRFMQCLEGAVARARVDSHYAYAVMFLDFDRFKLINDSLGHGAGDALLVQVARRLQERLRPSDVVARLGGDEFALFTERIGHERDAVSLAERLLEAFRRPFTVAGHELQVSASIGVTFGSHGDRNAEAVLRDADTAMYQAKADGRARVAVFDGGLHAEVSRRLRLEGDLRRAIDNDGLAVAYQPIFDLQRGAMGPGHHGARGGGQRAGLRGLEALVRWHHPTEGTLTPGAFLPIAEEAGLMPRLSAFVLRTACHQLRAWQLSDPGWADLTVSVNVAAEDLTEPGFAERVQAALLDSGLLGEHLTLELTENTLMSNVDGAIATLAQLRRLGVRVAVDDFGTGYSSLSYLARLPIDALKIDRSFVAHLTTDANEAAVVGAIIQLGQSLRKAIVAEGIESSRQVDQLLALGCQVGQGHHLAEPLDLAATSALLAAERGGSRGATRLH